MEVLIGAMILMGQLAVDAYKKRDAAEYARRRVRR